jgi:hypothetical protein
MLNNKIFYTFFFLLVSIVLTFCDISKLKIFDLDVGQSDGEIIQTPQGYVVLIEQKTYNSSGHPRSDPLFFWRSKSNVNHLKECVSNYRIKSEDLHISSPSPDIKFICKLIRFLLSLLLLIIVNTIF